MKRIVWLAAGFLIMPLLVFANEAKITAVKGAADIKSPAGAAWYAATAGSTVKSGQAIKTKARSRVNIQLSDGSRIEIRPNSQVDLSDLSPKTPAFKMAIGRIKAWVSKNTSRSKFEIKTPVAVCSVRGTEFTVDVDDKGMTDIAVLEGLVNVSKLDGSGDVVPVGAGERLNVTMEKPLTMEQRTEAIADKIAIQREVGLSMSKEAVQAAAAAEMRLAEYQEGKAMIDVNGNRVRIEEYVMRPAPDTFKLVVLNERADRFDYFYYLGKFNKTLPTDLSVALGQMNGLFGATAPEYYLTEYEKGFSNTQDYAKDTATGGHLVQITYNANGTITLSDPTNAANTKTVNAYDATNGAYDPITDTFDTTRTSALDITVFDPSTDAFQSFGAGQTYWSTRFNSYQHIINGVVKQWYLNGSASTNILAADLDGHWLYPALDSANNLIYGEWDPASTENSFPDGSSMHNRLKITYKDGTFEQYDTYIIDDEGKMAKQSDFEGITTGAQYKERLLKWNYQQVLTASEFGGRKIDLVVEPKILIKSGLIK